MHHNLTMLNSLLLLIVSASLLISWLYIVQPSSDGAAVLSSVHQAALSHRIYSVSSFFFWVYAQSLHKTAPRVLCVSLLVIPVSGCILIYLDFNRLCAHCLSFLTKTNVLTRQGLLYSHLHFWHP